MNMTIESFFIILLVGLVAGFVSGLILRGKGFGFVGNIVVGIMGAFVGNWVFRLAGVESVNNVGQLLIAVIGALLLLWPLQLIIRAVARKR